jgi:mono/diheme cytochrome c family protein
VGAVLAVLALAGAVIALLLVPLPESPPGPEPGRTLYQAHCATCHGADGRGDSWRARLLLLRPGNLAGPEMGGLPDGYLEDVIRHGGSTFGKPGMPSFGHTLGDAEIRALVAYLRSLSRAGTPAGRARAGASLAGPWRGSSATPFRRPPAR